MTEIMTAEKFAREGKSAYQRGDYQDAALSFVSARQVYFSDGNKLDAAEMANNASVAYLQAGDAELALEVVLGTADIFAEHADHRRQGMALGNEAAALEALDRVDEAAALYQISAAILGEAGEDQLRAIVMQSLSMLQFRKGHQLQALATMQDGLETVKHPNPKQSLIKKLLHVPIEMITRNKTS